MDDTGTIHVHWDNGCCLGVVYGEDSCRKLNTVKVICYNDEEVWDSREEALEFYMKEVHDQQGVGIGLYLAREIVTRQGGYIKVVSELRQGSEFSIMLPVR